MRKNLLIGLIFTITTGVVNGQSIDSLAYDFIKWRINEILQTDCETARSIQIASTFESWGSEKKFVENYLMNKRQDQLEAMWSKDKESYDILDSLRSILTSKNYNEISTQLSQSIHEKQSEFGIKYDCNSQGQSITFKLTKPIVIIDQKLIVVVESVNYQTDNCTAKQITSYKKIGSSWIEYLNFFRSNVCI